MIETGTVIFYLDQKGYGFIERDAGGENVFVQADAKGMIYS